MQRSGKSYLLNKLGAAYAKAGRWALAYNLGMSTDFASAKKIDLLPISDTVEHLRNVAGDAVAKEAQRKRANLLWKDTGGAVFAMKDWNARIAGRFVKSPRLVGADERGLVESVYQYMGGGLFLWDDARVSFRQGLSPEATQLFTRINHAGEKSAWLKSRGQGIDVTLVFHSVAQVNPDLLDAATHLTLFKNTREPDVRKLDNPQAENAMMTAHKRLSKAPNYWRVDVDLMNPKGVLSVMYDKNGKLQSTWTT